MRRRGFLGELCLGLLLLTGLALFLGTANFSGWSESQLKVIRKLGIKGKKTVVVFTSPT